MSNLLLYFVLSSWIALWIISAFSLLNRPISSPAQSMVFIFISMVMDLSSEMMLSMVQM